MKNGEKKNNQNSAKDKWKNNKKENKIEKIKRLLGLDEKEETEEKEENEQNGQKEENKEKKEKELPGANEEKEKIEERAYKDEYKAKKECKKFKVKKEKETKDENSNQIIETNSKKERQNNSDLEVASDEIISWNQILNEEFDNIIINTSTEEKKESSHDSEEEKNIDIRINSNKSEQNIKENNSNDKIGSKEITKMIPEKDITKIDETIIFNGREYKYYSRYNKYYNTRKIKKLIYKCVNIRKNERIILETNQSLFCNATIEFIEENQHVTSGYFLTKKHSIECDNLFFQNLNNNIDLPDKKIKDKENFIEECKNIMEQSTIYDRNLYKEEFKKLYNNNKYNFPLNNNLLSNIITKWKNTTNRFNKYSILENTKDKENRLILREYRCIPIEESNKIRNNNIEYAIWGNMENINRMRKSKNIF